ncbi:MAG: hypothetical protein WDM80_13125 [Limisphaerales bacterium]
MNQEQQLKLQAFLDGELPECEKRVILLWLQTITRPPRCCGVEKHTAGHGKIRTALSVPESRDFFWSKIEREIQRLEPETTAATDAYIFIALRRWFFLRLPWARLFSPVWSPF